MSHQIFPQEFNLLQDNANIRTKCPWGEVTDAMVERRAKNGNLVAGDVVRVQCMNHDYTELLAEAEYRVISRTSVLKMVEVNDRDTRQVDQIDYKVDRWTPWHFPGQQAGSTQLADFTRIASGGEAIWNFGLKGWEIFSSGERVGFHEDKETAEKIASGALPLPGKAA